MLFVHYEVEPIVLQPLAPFELELLGGKAIVSLVWFTMRRFRPRWGGRLAECLGLPVATNRFFNVRTYVRHCGEPGAYFMTQWLSHPLCLLGRLPALRLPWRWGSMAFQHTHEAGSLTGRIAARNGTWLAYSARVPPRDPFTAAEQGSLAEFAMERYTAFALRGGREVVFRVWHEPWPQRSVEARVEDTGLLAQSGHWHRHARLVGANYSIGLGEVWMGRVRSIQSTRKAGRRPNRRVLSGFFEMP